jgi:hypothetical protein
MPKDNQINVRRVVSREKNHVVSDVYLKSESNALLLFLFLLGSWHREK